MKWKCISVDTMDSLNERKWGEVGRRKQDLRRFRDVLLSLLAKLVAGKDITVLFANHENRRLKTRGWSGRAPACRQRSLPLVKRDASEGKSDVKK